MHALTDETSSCTDWSSFGLAINSAYVYLIHAVVTGASEGIGRAYALEVYTCVHGCVVAARVPDYGSETSY